MPSCAVKPSSSFSSSPLSPSRRAACALNHALTECRFFRTFTRGSAGVACCTAVRMELKLHLRTGPGLSLSRTAMLGDRCVEEKEEARDDADEDVGRGGADSTWTYSSSELRRGGDDTEECCEARGRRDGRLHGRGHQRREHRGRGVRGRAVVQFG